MATPNERGVLSVAVNEHDHAQGPANAAVTILEYGDYECPYCKRAYPIVRQLQQAMGADLRLVFRHFPQNSVHPRAAVAAQAAEAAAAQGKFWPMHEQLYEHQDQLAELSPTAFALRVPGLEIYKFEAALSAQTHAQRVWDDYTSGVNSGVKRTPTFFINGVRYDGPTEFDPMLNALRDAKSAASAAASVPHPSDTPAGRRS